MIKTNRFIQFTCTKTRNKTEKVFFFSGAFNTAKPRNKEKRKQSETRINVGN